MEKQGWIKRDDGHTMVLLSSYIYSLYGWYWCTKDLYHLFSPCAMKDNAEHHADGLSIYSLILYRYSMHTHDVQKSLCQEGLNQKLSLYQFMCDLLSFYVVKVWPCRCAGRQNIIEFEWKYNMAARTFLHLWLNLCACLCASAQNAQVQRRGEWKGQRW